jgi:hypothetical protein
MPVVLLASVFERTRYKRKATNLYGADAYLELHHVPDRLVPLLQSLQKREPLFDPHLQAPVERARAAGLRIDGAHASAPEAATGDLEAAQALARRLLSDVVLYHGDEVADGVRRGQPFGSISGAVDAARELYLQSSRHADVFETELAALANRLLERDHHGAPRDRSPVDAGRRVRDA